MFCKIYFEFIFRINSYNNEKGKNNQIEFVEEEKLDSNKDNSKDNIKAE